MDKQTNEQTNTIKGQIDGCMDGWITMDKLRNEWMNK